MSVLPPPGEEGEGERPEGSPPLSDRLPDLPDGTVVPDDISGLHADVEAWRRERAAARRRARLDGLLLSRRRHAYGISGAMVMVALCVVGVVGLLLVVFGPRAGVDAPRQTVALATPTASPGAIDGLLPDVPLTQLTGDTVAFGVTASAVHSSRDLGRPAVLVIVPDSCGCAAAVHHALAAAQEASFHPYVVAAATADVHRYADPDASIADGVLDASGALADTYRTLPGAPTVVVMRPDGVVSAVQTGISPDTSLDGVLTSVPVAGAGAGSGASAS